MSGCHWSPQYWGCLWMSLRKRLLPSFCVQDAGRAGKSGALAIFLLTKQPPQSGSHFSRGAKVLFKVWFLPFLPLPSLGRKSPNHPSPVMANSGPCHPLSQLRAKVHFSKWKPNYTNPLIKFIQWLPTALEIEVRNQILQCPSSPVTFHQASLSLLLRAFSKFIEHTHSSSCTEPSPGHSSLSLSFLSSSPSQLLVLLGSVLTSLMDKLSLTSLNRSFIL